MKQETKKQILGDLEKALYSLGAMMAVLMIGVIFALSAFTVFIFNFFNDLSFFGLISIWAALFYVFSLVVFQFWEQLKKRYDKK